MIIGLLVVFFLMRKCNCDFIEDRMMRRNSFQSKLVGYTVNLTCDYVKEKVGEIEKGFEIQWIRPGEIRSIDDADSVFFTVNAFSSSQLDDFFDKHNISTEKNSNIKGLIYNTCFSCFSGATGKSFGSTREHFDFGVYHTLKEIQDWLKTLPERVVKTYGQSYEKRPLQVIDIGEEEDPAILIECGIHAREWVSVAFCPFLIDQILSKNWERDGIRFNRFWRKNRRIIRDSPCHGVDLNRNFDIEWGKHSTSESPCGETFGGSAPFSEPESAAFRDYAMKIETKIAFVSYHAYSEFIIYPYSASIKRNSPYKDALKSLALRMSKAIYQEHGREYSYGEGAVAFYAASGGSDDWIHNQGVPISYTIELRDKGLNGFLLPENELIETFTENMKGLQEIVNDVRNITRFSQFFKATKTPFTIPETTPFFFETTEKTMSTFEADHHSTLNNSKNLRLAHEILEQYSLISPENSGFATLSEEVIDNFEKWSLKSTDFTKEKLRNIGKNVPFGEFLEENYFFIVKNAYKPSYLQSMLLDFVENLHSGLDNIFIPIITTDWVEILYQEKTAKNFKFQLTKFLSPAEKERFQLALQKSSEEFASVVFLLEVSVFLDSRGHQLEEKFVENLRPAARADFDIEKLTIETFSAAVKQIYGKETAAKARKQYNKFLKTAEKEIVHCFFFKPINKIIRSENGEIESSRIALDLELSFANQQKIISKNDDSEKSVISACSFKKLDGFSIQTWGNEKSTNSQLFEISHTSGSDLLFCENGCDTESSTILSTGQAIKIVKNDPVSTTDLLIPPMICDQACLFSLVRREYTREHLFQRIIYRFLLDSGFPNPKSIDLSVFEIRYFFKIRAIFLKDPRIAPMTEHPEFSTMLIFTSIYSRMNADLDFDQLMRFLSTILGSFSGQTADDITFSRYFASMIALQREVSSDIVAFKAGLGNLC
ncbi:Oidioi.mRNA.OKI2018_I69.chr2.g5246.t1.cds [Oikopleura dioica]|uniref:Oidioi.mRNA.OKI2018_I69.chr2.g5246.t1.cds n=1 Tax=Oikopleura dioica TaxID=34765 RepID=A0ABN7T350_OIKDI|nr:Oidioi.mRNA.OKI2018_I69.chr2.g5246.t1.cds [Oikopleura dioica]